MKDDKQDNRHSLNERIHKAKQFAADEIGRRVNALSPPYKKVSLLLFGLLMAVVCLAQIIQAMTEGRNDALYKVEQITRPHDIHQENSISHPSVLNLKTFLDSLKGTALYDSLTINRPGLIDTLNALAK